MFVAMEGRYSEREGNLFLSNISDQMIANNVIFSSLCVGSVILNGDGVIRQMNTRALEDLKWKRENVIGKNLFELLGVFREKQNLLPEVMARLERGTKFVELPGDAYIRVSRGNDKFYINGQLLGLREGGRLSKVVFFFRNYENDLTREYLLNLALAKTKIFPWFFDLERNKMNIDSRWFTHLGYPAREESIDTEEFAAFVHPDDREVLIGALARQIAGQLNEDLFTYRLRRADGTWEWFEEQSVYLGQIEGAPYRIVGVCHSIHDHKMTESNLIDARDKAQVSDRLKSAFLANMSHEIRTPLNAIVGFSNLLTDPGVELDEEEKKEYAKLINTNSEQLLLLISDILDLSKIEANTMEFHYSNQPLNDLFSDIYHAQVLNMPPGVELRMDVPEGDFCLNTDPMRLKQVINNLINNAVKFTSKGYISFGYRMAKSGNEICLYVQDTGTGISEEYRKKIFERFYKIDNFKGGAGLGLSICQTIINYLGGSIELNFDLGIGTCFVVRHPLTVVKVRSCAAGI